MSLPTTRPQRRSLTGSARKLDKKESAYSKRVAQPWQNRCLYYYDEIGELRFASWFYARMLSRVRYFPARLEDDGTKTPIASGRPVEILNRVQDPGGGRSRLQFDYGRLMFVTGEGVLFAFEKTGVEQWEFLWREEVKILDDGSAVRLDAQRSETNERGTAYRFWVPHPKHSDLPDSPMRPVTDIAEELIILTRSVRSTATSRMLHGILGIASEMSPAPDEPGSDEDPEQNPFLADYIEHVRAEIEDPGAAEAMVPFLFEGPYDYMKNNEGLWWLKTHDPANDYLERDLRIEAIKRLALSMDMPPEALLGFTDANHWTAKQVQHDMWRAHGIPVAERFAVDLADTILRPALRDEAFADWQRVVLDYDDSEVIISPDRTQDANDAADRGMLSDIGYRELMGIDESMKPSEEEKNLWLAVKLRDPAIAGLEGIVPTAARGPVPNAGSNGHPAEGPPEPTKGRAVSREEARTAAIVGAAQFALRQARGKVGAKLRAKRCPECKPLIDGQPNSLVAALLGEVQVGELIGGDMLSVIRGVTSEFAHALQDEWGISSGEAESLCNRLEIYAAKTLFEPGPPGLPPGFASQVEQAQEVSSAVAT